MNINDGESDVSSTVASEIDAVMDINESEMDQSARKSTGSLEWQNNRSPYQSFLYGWGNTQDGELGLGGIEENHILEPREVTFHDSENIKYGKSFTCYAVKERNTTMQPYNEHLTTNAS